MIKRKMRAFLEKMIWYIAKKSAKAPKSTIQLIWQDAVRESADFIKEFASDSLLFYEKEQIWDFVLKESKRDGLRIECGVYKANSINYFAKKYPDITFYGFDSFEGLQEHWTGHFKPKGSFKIDKNIVKVEKNVSLISGWVDATLLPFLSEKKEDISFLHIDTDTYSPALTILKTAKPFLKKGTIILFDELVGYPNWRNGEFKALHEVLDKDEFEFIAFSNTQAAIRIKYTS